MEAEAEFLRREIVLNGTRVQFRLLKAKSKAEVVVSRAECLERWMAVLRYWDAECKKFFNPKDDTEVNIAAQKAALGFE